MRPVNAMDEASLRFVRPDNDVFALGLAVNHLMTKPAFASLRFGDWSQVLVGQINRKHFWFVVDDRELVQGFMGWALATREVAEAWVTGRCDFRSEDSQDGEYVIANAWSANSTGVHRFMVAKGRQLFARRRAVYFKRHYASGKVRAVRLSLNPRVGGDLLGE